MTIEAGAAQEQRSERAGVMLTAQEKKDLRFFADAKGLTESDALRNHTVAEITAEAADMRKRLGIAA